MDLTEQIDNGFLQLTSLSDDRINLAHGALLIAKAAYPDLDESLYLARLDRLAADVKRDLMADIDAAAIIAIYISSRPDVPDIKTHPDPDRQLWQLEEHHGPEIDPVSSERDVACKNQLSICSVKSNLKEAPSLTRIAAKG